MLFQTFFSLILLAAGKEKAAFEGVLPPPSGLPPIKGRSITVKTLGELEEAVDHLQSNTTVLIAPGTYVLTHPLNFRNKISNVGIRGLLKNRDKVVILGGGHNNRASADTIPHCIMVSDATDVTIANLSVGDVWYHPITLQGQDGCKRVLIHNLRIFDAGEQCIKANPAPDGVGVEDVTIEYCLMEYIKIPRHDYINGVNVLGTNRWTIRYNLFRHVRAPEGQQAGPTIVMWRHSQNTVCLNNVFVDCQRGIAYGLENRTPTGRGFDHTAGRIEGNIFYRPPGKDGDTGIHAWDSPGTQIRGNTVVVSGTYPSAIEYRWPSSTGVVIENNVVDAEILRREGAEADLKDNRKITPDELKALRAKLDKLMIR